VSYPCSEDYDPYAPHPHDLTGEEPGWSEDITVDILAMQAEDIERKDARLAEYRKLVRRLVDIVHDYEDSI
jgi:hypothetical protein